MVFKRSNRLNLYEKKKTINNLYDKILYIKRTICEKIASSEQCFNINLIKSTGGLVLLAAGFLTQTFQFIPKATLAGLIISAMYYMLDFRVFKLFWTAKSNYFYLILTGKFLSTIYFNHDV